MLSDKKYNLYTDNDLQDETPLKRLDTGLDFRLNYSLSWSFIDDVYIYYRLGLTNVENTDASSGVEQSTKNRFLSLGIRSSLSNLLNKI